MNLKELRKKVIVAFITLMIALVASVGATYAYWHNYIQTQDVADIVIGEGATFSVSVTAAPPAGKTLVPFGIPKTADQVDTITLIYDVELDVDLDSAVDLTVTYDALLLGVVDTYNDLVNIEITPSMTAIQNDVVTITVTVTIDEPADEAEYNAVVGQDITFSLVFTVE